MTFYHLTWERHLDSIFYLGLVTNYRPNPWTIPNAMEHSREGVFVTGMSRSRWWEEGFAGRMVGGYRDRLVRLAVDTHGLHRIPDCDWLSVDEEVPEIWVSLIDFIVLEPIYPERIRVHEVVDEQETGAYFDRGVA